MYDLSEDSLLRDVKQQLSQILKKDFDEITKNMAERILTKMIYEENEDLNELCRNPDLAPLRASHLIKEEAEWLSSVPYENRLVAGDYAELAQLLEFEGFLNEKEVVEEICSDCKGVEDVFKKIAYNVWKAGISRQLVKVLKRECKMRGMGGGEV